MFNETNIVESEKKIIISTIKLFFILEFCMVQILNLPFFKNVAKRKVEKMRRENGKRIKVPLVIHL
jgi:hypothetical protein